MSAPGKLYIFAICIVTTACLVEIGESRHEKYGNGGLNMRLEIPRYPKVGDRITLGCKHDLGTDGSLYTVKWYRGASEFYRFTPKESPPIKTFGFPGPDVDTYYSNATQLVIRRATLAMSGKYSCEVTTDSPDFTTELKSESLHVIQFPTAKPEITPTKARYSIGDVVDINCTTSRSRPAANLTWYINKTPAQLLVSSTLEKERKPGDLTETSRLGLRFQLQPLHFKNSTVKLQCNATIYDRYQQSSEVIIYQADKPQISSIVDTYSSDSSSGSHNNGGSGNSGKSHHRLRGRSAAGSNNSRVYSSNQQIAIAMSHLLFIFTIGSYLLWSVNFIHSNEDGNRTYL